MESHSLYLHIPFCTHRCGYCDFNTYAGLEHLMGDYALALAEEMRLFREAAGERLPVHTVFFGGGTPSLLPLPLLEGVFAAIRENFDLTPDPEITLEANPGTVSREYLAGLSGLGVNRLSMGVQSASPEELRLLERLHGYQDAIQAVKWARQAGFDNLSVDLIFGLPYQTLEAWQHNLELALGLHPEHISLYALTVEHGTPLQHMVSRGLVSEPDGDAAADMYEWTMERLERESFVHYEISNWARPDGTGGALVSRHNLQYWHNQPYIGMGAGAHGWVDGMRIANVLGPAVYIERCRDGKVARFPRSSATSTAKRVDRQTEMGETMMMGLRLVEEGVSGREFEGRFGVGLVEAYGREIGELEQAGLVEWAGDALRLTRRGRLLGNQVFMKFV